MKRAALAAILAATALLLTGYSLGKSASRPAQDIPADTSQYRAVVIEPDPERTGASSSPPSPVSTQDGGSASRLAGIASWGYGWEGVVTRLHRGTAICVTGPLGTWCGRSVGYGPAIWTNRIADLSAVVFERICGPLSKGLCRVVLSW